MTGVYIVTDYDLGWDNIVGVFYNEQDAENACGPEPDEVEWFRENGYLDVNGMFETRHIHYKEIKGEKQ